MKPATRQAVLQLNPSRPPGLSRTSWLLAVLSLSSGNSTEGSELPTCDPDTQPALAPNFAQLDVSITPGSNKAVDSYLCTRGTTGAVLK